MMDNDDFVEMLHPDEYDWIKQVVEKLGDDEVKLVYADWLGDRGDDRADFLRQFVSAAKTMDAGDFPNPKGIPEAWLELIGFRLLEKIANEKCIDLKEPALKLARPALRFWYSPVEDEEIEIGGSKIGGLPDLPADFAWPPGGDCKAIYNDDTGGTDRLAGFMCQVNLDEIAQTIAANDANMPKTGLLSFFCFQDIENDNPDAVGVLALHFKDADNLVRTEPPKELTEGNEVIEPNQLYFEETLDLPGSYDGPWSDEINPEPENAERDNVLTHFRELNFDNMLGYGRSTTGGDPTRSKESRHLIILNNAVECRMHIQIPKDALSTGDFSKITLDWVDFD